ncbi:MAG: hypothetical protein APF81_00075 [Desulfosporosinus sp. BRH_c37]|nr:MAG: hypothetical protein APF81_00075 [Desulfosporosinus sp. BRH_c37]
MSSISSTPALKQPTRLAVIIPIKSFSPKKARFLPCIFCGETIQIKKFKGKTVCTHCLLQIPDIFSYS